MALDWVGWWTRLNQPPVGLNQNQQQMEHKEAATHNPVVLAVALAVALLS